MGASEFSHTLSGVRYQVSKQPEGFTLAYTQKQPAGSSEIRGTQELTYFIGSGNVGRSYLFSVTGFLFQAPVSYYARSKKWDLAPGYQQHSELFLMRPVEAECLECHASGVQPIPGTQNGYKDLPFGEGRISCERCHGPGRSHIAGRTSGQPVTSQEIVNPAKLEVRPRDSVCAQCHLLGESRIVKAGRSLSRFTPGEWLSDYAASLIWNSKNVAALKATATITLAEPLQTGSGDRMWCGTCHALHSPPPQQSGVLSPEVFICHQSGDCRERAKVRETRGDQCTSCHKPKAQSLEAEHSVFTDHSIPRGARSQPVVAETDAESELVSFWGGKADRRELGLAYAQLGVRLQDKKRVSGHGATEAAEAKARWTLQSCSTRLRQRPTGKSTEAIAYYQRARQQDPSQTVASVNLANHLAMKGQTGEAIVLWEEALSRNPGLEYARINIATAYLQQGDPKSAERALRKALELNPALKSARRLLADPRISKSSR
jgi:hypothetical protein